MIKLEKSIAIIGAGVAGLGCAYRLEQELLTEKPFRLSITLFDKESYVGGRTKTTSKVDTGASYLTFDTLQRPDETAKLIRQQFNEGLVQIFKPTYLYRDGKIEPGDRQSSKFSYTQGINQLAQQLKNRLKITSVQLNSKIERVEWGPEESNVHFSDGKQKQYDVIVLAVPNPSELVPGILNIPTIQYTRQITATFQITSELPQYSCVLFPQSNAPHPFTFICWHDEKTGVENLVNIQLSNKASHELWNRGDEEVVEMIRNYIPKSIELKDMMGIQRWYPALRRGELRVPTKLQNSIFAVGDSTLPKSRVVSSLESGILGAQRILKEIQDCTL